MGVYCAVEGLPPIESALGVGGIAAEVAVMLFIIMMHSPFWGVKRILLYLKNKKNQLNNWFFFVFSKKL